MSALRAGQFPHASPVRLSAAPEQQPACLILVESTFVFHYTLERGDTVCSLPSTLALGTHPISEEPPISLVELYHRLPCN